jgi:uncharacterized membrane protein YeaQ/YmgE (transglycosylase-associated protein family)
MKSALHLLFGATHFPRALLFVYNKSTFVGYCCRNIQPIWEDKMDLTSLIIWIIIGAIAGWLADAVVGGVGVGLIGAIIAGIVGAVIGGWLFSLLGISIGGGIIGSIITAFVGAVILLLILRLIRGGRTV